MNACVRNASLTVFLLWQPNVAVAETVITLKDSNKSPMYIGWMGCQPGSHDARENEASTVSHAIVQYGEEARLRSEWLKRELEIDRDVWGMSPTQLISIMALVVTVLASIFIAWAQHRHNKRMQAKILTLKIWEEYLGKHKEFTRALDVLNHPCNTDQSGFSTVQGVRAWLDGIASLDSVGELNRGMLKMLTIHRPLKSFLDNLHKAAVSVEAAYKAGNEEVEDWVQPYQEEVDESCGINDFLERIRKA